MIKNEMKRKWMLTVGLLGCIVLSSAVSGCTGEEQGKEAMKQKRQSTSEVSATATPSATAKGDSERGATMQKIANAISRDVEAFLKESADRIRESVQELQKNSDGTYHYSYTAGEVSISIDTKGFEQDNHGKYQLLRIYQGEEGRIYIVILHRTEDEKVYGVVYRYSE